MLGKYGIEPFAHQPEFVVMNAVPPVGFVPPDCCSLKVRQQGQDACQQVIRQRVQQLQAEYVLRHNINPSRAPDARVVYHTKLLEHFHCILISVTDRAVPTQCCNFVNPYREVISKPSRLSNFLVAMTLRDQYTCAYWASSTTQRVGMLFYAGA